MPVSYMYMRLMGGETIHVRTLPQSPDGETRKFSIKRVTSEYNMPGYTVILPDGTTPASHNCMFLGKQAIENWAAELEEVKREGQLMTIEKMIELLERVDHSDDRSVRMNAKIQVQFSYLTNDPIKSSIINGIFMDFVRGPIYKDPIAIEYFAKIFYSIVYEL